MLLNCHPEQRRGGGRAAMANTATKSCAQRGREGGKEDARCSLQAGRRAGGAFFVVARSSGPFLHGESPYRKGSLCLYMGESLRTSQVSQGSFSTLHWSCFNILGGLPKTEAPFRAFLSISLGKGELRRGGAGCLPRGRGAESCRCGYQKEDCPNILSLFSFHSLSVSGWVPSANDTLSGKERWETGRLHSILQHTLSSVKMYFISVWLMKKTIMNGWVGGSSGGDVPFVAWLAALFSNISSHFLFANKWK